MENNVAQDMSVWRNETDVVQHMFAKMQNNVVPDQSKINNIDWSGTALSAEMLYNVPWDQYK